MTFSFVCPKCGKNYRNVKTTLLGKKARCSCGNIIRVGDPDSAKVDDPEKPGTSGRTSNLEVPTGKQKKPNQPIPTVEVKLTAKPLVDDHFSDLDDILSGRDFGEQPEVRRPRPKPQLRRPVADEYRPELGPPVELLEPVEHHSSTTGATIGLLAAIASATLAFWFGLLIVLVRFVEFDQILLKDFAATISEMNVGKFGTDMIGQGVQSGFASNGFASNGFASNGFASNGFAWIGWAMWCTALLMIFFATGQFLNGIIKLFLGKSILRWIDGLVATVAIVFVFLVVGSLFLQSSRLSALNRELKQYEVPGAVGESSPQNVVMIRERYRQHNLKFVTVMVISGIVPFAVFTFSMIRLFVSTGEVSDSRRLS